MADQWFDQIGEGKVLSISLPGCAIACGTRIMPLKFPHPPVHVINALRKLGKQSLWGGLHHCQAQTCHALAYGQLMLLLLQVYLISKGRVKPANKAYATARNDYAIDLGSE